MCGLFWGAHKSLAPRARTLLGGLGQATLSFSASQRLYCSSVLVSVLNFATSPNSGVKLLGGFLRSEKTIFRFISSGGASFSLFFFFFCNPTVFTWSSLCCSIALRKFKRSCEEDKRTQRC